MLDSSGFVEVAAERKDEKFVVQYLLSRFPETPITRNALLAAASNEAVTTSLLGFLLKHSHTIFDSKLLELAAGNKYRGTRMAELLLANYPADAKVERGVVVAALGNPFCGQSLLTLFLARKLDITVAQDIIDAASENRVPNKILLQMLLKHTLTLCSTISADLILTKMKSTAEGLRDSLFMAACSGDDVILCYIMSHNVSLSLTSGELGTALNVAVYAGRIKVVEILLDNGSDLESYSKLYGTPLQSACQNGNLDIVRALAKHGVEIDRSNQMGRTELHTSLGKGNYDLADLLIALGGSTANKDHQGMTAMHHASLQTKSTHCVDLLIRSGNPVDPEDSQHWTPLHWAVRCGVVNTVTKLLEAGAAKNIIDASGKNLFHIAMLCGNAHLRPKLFLNEMSDLDVEPAGKEHKGVVCDACDWVSLRRANATIQIYVLTPINAKFQLIISLKQDIQGPRHKCINCDDFDLCFCCIVDAKQIHEPSHDFEHLGG